MYRVVVQDEAKPTVGALPADGVIAWFKTLDVLVGDPWAGEISRKDNPDANILTLHFGPAGEGMVTYMVLERDREVHVLEVQWAG